MDVTIQDGAVLVYTLGVMVSGIWLVTGRPTFTPRLVALIAVVAVFWTAYFKWRITPQFVPEEEEESEERDGPGSISAPDE
jgi:hypothetical protein